MENTNKLVLDWIENGEMCADLVAYVDGIVKYITSDLDERQSCWLKILSQRENINIDLFCANYLFVICHSQCAELRRKYVLEDIRRKKWLDLTKHQNS